MIYLTAQPNRIKFYWQLRVQLENMLRLGMPLEDVHILVGVDVGPVLAQFHRLGDLGARVFAYPYQRDDAYLPSVRPHILAQHLTHYPELLHADILYLDSDVLFSRKFDVSNLQLDGSTCYVSDTRSYLDSKYIKSCGQAIFYELCGVVGINPLMVEWGDERAGGAQYLFRGLDPAFWWQVEADALALYKHYQARLPEYTKQGCREFQIWCADMWALLWNLWKRGVNTKVVPELDFAWGTSGIDVYHQRPLFHLAGITPQNQNDATGPHFNKADFNNSTPFGKDFSHINPKSATRPYVDLIQTITL